MHASCRSSAPAGWSRVRMPVDPCVPLRGDILVACYHRRPHGGRAGGGGGGGGELVFRCQFHTCAVADNKLLFSKHELDGACTGGTLAGRGQGAEGGDGVLREGAGCRGRGQLAEGGGG